MPWRSVVARHRRSLGGFCCPSARIPSCAVCGLTTIGPGSAPRVIGSDDWAWRKGQRYGTLICGLERRQVIDLLPDHEPATVEAWLRARPGIEVVAHDRNGGYGGAVARALPHAVHVADRWRRLPADGVRGSLRVVGEGATRQRRAAQASPSGPGKSPPARRIARLMTLGRDHLSRADAVLVARIEAAIPALAAARALTDRFTGMTRNARETALAAWLDEAEDSLIAAFARGLRSDQAVVAAALREPRSNGQAEGQINRLKTIKRSMYGRANIDLLNTRLITAE